MVQPHTFLIQLRSAEKTWRKFKIHENLISFRQHSSKYRFMIKKAKHEYYIDTIKSAGNDTKKSIPDIKFSIRS